MTIRNRLTFFIFITSALSGLIAASVIMFNARYYLEKQSGDSLRALEASFQFIFEDYIQQYRNLSEYTAKNSDINIFISESNSIMTFVTKRAANEELEKLVHENDAIKYAYIQKNNNVILGKSLDIPLSFDTGNFLKFKEKSNAFYKLNIKLLSIPSTSLVVIIDLNNLISKKLNEIRINNKTHFFIYHNKSKEFILHTENKIFDFIDDELKQNKQLLKGLNNEGLNSYRLNGIERMAYITKLNELTFGVSIPFSAFNISIKALIQFFITTAIVLIGIIIFVSYFASRYVTKPLREMASSVKDISEKKYDSRILIEHDDEVGIVSSAINSMADQIKDYTENLEDMIKDRTSQLQEALDQVKKMSITDDLTRIYNRKHFEASLQKELARVKRNSHVFSLVFFDLDHFKSVNDTYGHKEGDNVLISTGKIIRETIRETDLSARWGGEEFIIILYNTNITGAFKVAEKLREKLANVIHPKAGHVTGSFGITQWKDGDDNTSLVLRCDEALYKSKEEGRNRTTIG